MTFTVHLAFAASVLPQVLLATAKSPLGAMLLMLRVEAPVLVRVTVLGLLVTPTSVLGNVRDAGERFTMGPLAVTVSAIVVWLVKLSDTPLMVMVDVPRAAPLLAARVSVLVVVVGFGANPAVTPLGRPEALKVTSPLKPSLSVTVIVLVPVLPSETLSVFGLAANENDCVCPKKSDMAAVAYEVGGSVLHASP